MHSDHEIKTALLGFLLVLLTGLWCLTAATPAAGRTNKRLQAPGSHLGPAGNGPIFVGGFLQGGGAFAYTDAYLGYGGTLLARPEASADFLPLLYRWNCGAVLQIEQQKLGPDMGLLSADGLLRFYLDDMRDPDAPGSAFVGFGMGATRVDPPRSFRGSTKKYWSLLLEAGREWTWREEYVIWVRAQYRHYDWADLDYRTWTVQVGAGLPWPF